MSFWTGLEAFTGHRPGAFTGMTMKDLFDKDMWDRLPRTWSGQKTPTGPNDIRMGRGGEPMMTNWYNRNAGSGPTDSVNQQQSRTHAMQNLGYPSMNATYPAMPAQAQMFPYKRQDVKAVPVPGWTAPRNPAEVIQETGPYWGMGDPYSGWGGYLGSAKKAHMGMGASGYQVPPTPQFDSTMADMTTVKKITDDASPNTITQTVKQKVPANPTNTLMNMKSPTDSYTGWGDLWRKTILNPAHAPSFVRNLGGMFNRGIDSLGVLARKRHEEEMLRRQRGY